MPSIAVKSKFADFVDVNPSIRLPDQLPDEVAFVEMQAITPGRRWVTSSEQKPAPGTGSRFGNGDTLFARITPCLENGKIAQFRGAKFARGSTEFFVLRAKPTKADPGFVYYFTLQPDFRSTAVKSMAGASGRQRADAEALRQFDCEFPKLKDQQEIARILSAYDDLIENNLRRIKILEQMAQSLYREWFVHFRFPGNDAASFKDSELGRIPEGWEVKAMTEAVTVRPKVAVPKNCDIPFVTMGGLSEDSMLITEVESRDKPTGARFQNGDTLFARITPCLENGKTGYVEFLPSNDSAACGSTEFIVLRSKTLCPQYVYLMARSDAFRDNAIKSMSGATGRQRVRDECFDQFFLAQPPEDLLARLESITRPQFELIHSLHRRNQTLRRTRDLLLPKLLSPTNS
jgi:type I restriction enzyme S subunit